jgi:hypothetical protein
MQITTEQINRLNLDNLAYSEKLEPVPKRSWPPSRTPIPPAEVWRSRHFMVLVYAEKNGIERLSIHRTAYDPATQRWKDGITWDELQSLKAQCGRGDKEAVEIYPRDADLVNVANMRHLFVLPVPTEFSWKKQGKTYEQPK